MPGGGDPVGGIVQATDNGRGRGTFLPRTAEGTGTVQVVQRGDGGWINCRARENTTCASGIG